jgi:hypothetical protein
MRIAASKTKANLVFFMVAVLLEGHAFCAFTCLDTAATYCVQVELNFGIYAISLRRSLPEAVWGAHRALNCVMASY